MSEAIETAKLYIANAEEQARRDDRERAQSNALVGIGFALIGIGEALERDAVEVLEVIPEGDNVAHRTSALDMR